MRTMTPPGAIRSILIRLLVGGWLLGLVVQWGILQATGYLDVPPPLLLLGMAICFLAGALVRVSAPVSSRARRGAVAGVAGMASIVVGYFGLAIAYRDRFTGGSDETWWSLLLEAWFWVGIPLVVSAVAGIAGWRVAGRWAGPPAQD